MKHLNELMSALDYYGPLDEEATKLNHSQLITTFGKQKKPNQEKFEIVLTLIIDFRSLRKAIITFNNRCIVLHHSPQKKTCSSFYLS